MKPDNAGKRLLSWLKGQDMTQRAFANQFEITESMVSGLVNGDRKPSLVLAARIQAVTGIQATEWVESDDVEGVPV